MGRLNMASKTLARRLGILLAVLLWIAAPACAEVEPAQDFLTEEERQWLADHPVLRLGVGTSFPPYQWVEQENGIARFKGAVSEYVKILEQKLQVRMEIVFGVTFSQALELGKNKQIDLFPCLAANPERGQFLLFTSAYLSYPSVIITRQDGPLVGGMHDLRGRKISAVKDQIIWSALLNNSTRLSLQMVPTNNAEEDLQAVSFGRADACLMDLAVASYLIQKLRITNLKVAAPSGLETIELAMGVRNDWPMLHSIVQKTLATITQDEKDAINQRWIQLNYEPGVSRGQVLRWAVIAGSGIALVVAVQFLWNRSLRREITARKKIEQERNALISELTRALAEVKTLRGFLPICANCRKIRSDGGYWQQLETYIQEHTDAQFSHGICPDCLREHYPEVASKILARSASEANESGFEA